MVSAELTVVMSQPSTVNHCHVLCISGNGLKYHFENDLEQVKLFLKKAVISILIKNGLNIMVNNSRSSMNRQWQ